MQIAHRLEVWGYKNFRPPARTHTKLRSKIVDRKDLEDKGDKGDKGKESTTYECNLVSIEPAEAGFVCVAAISFSTGIFACIGMHPSEGERGRRGRNFSQGNELDMILLIYCS